MVLDPTREVWIAAGGCPDGPFRPNWKTGGHRRTPPRKQPSGKLPTCYYAVIRRSSTNRQPTGRKAQGATLPQPVQIVCPVEPSPKMTCTASGSCGGVTGKPSHTTKRQINEAHCRNDSDEIVFRQTHDCSCAQLDSRSTGIPVVWTLEDQSEPRDVTLKHPCQIPLSPKKFVLSSLRSKCQKVRPSL